MKRFTFSLLFVMSLILAVGSNDNRGRDLFGDLNNDGEVNIADLNVLIDVILNGQPATTDPVADHTPNMTIAEFKAKHWQDGRNYIDTVTEDEVIHGWITSSDESGNIYKTLYIADESGAGLAISVNKTNLYQDYPIGQEIVLPMKGYFVGKYNGMQQLGYPYWYEFGQTWKATFLPVDMWNELVELNGAPDPNCVQVQPAEVNLRDFAGKTDSETLLKYQGKLVRLTDVSFVEADGTTTYAAPNASTNRTIQDNNGLTLTVRNSNYANFAGQPLPQGKLEVVGILGMYNTTWQLYLRDVNDVTVTEESDPIAPVTMIDEGFDRSLPEDWSNVAVSGDKQWYHTAYQSNGYAAMTGYKGEQPPFDAWLITPAIDIKNADSKVLSFTTQVAIYTSTMTVFEVYILDSNDPNAANVKAKLNPVLATPSSTSTYSEVTPSGDIDLSQWADGVYYIGFRYYSPEDVNYGTWCVDNVKFGLAR